MEIMFASAKEPPGANSTLIVGGRGGMHGHCAHLDFIVWISILNFTGEINSINRRDEIFLIVHSLSVAWRLLRLRTS